MVIYFIIYAKEGIFFLSGTSYVGAIVPMQVIIPTILFIGLTNIMGIQILVPLNREIVVLYSEIVGAVVDLILNLLLIPKLAATGAAIGTLIAEISVFVYQLIVLKDQVINAYRKIHYGRIFIALVVSCLSCIWVKWFDFSSVLSLLISGTLFFGFYGIVLLILKEPLVNDIFKQILSKIARNI